MCSDARCSVARSIRMNARLDREGIYDQRLGSVGMTLFVWRDDSLRRAREFPAQISATCSCCRGICLAPLMRMRLLQWRPRSPPQRSTLEAGPIPFKFPAIGDFAGRARYVPGDVENLPPALAAAAGTVVDVDFAGIASPGGRFVGQSLYRECSGQNLLGGLVIPEQDLDFIL